MRVVNTYFKHFKPKLKNAYNLSMVSVNHLDTIVVIMEDEKGNSGYGEAVPLKYYTDETVDSIKEKVGGVLGGLKGETFNGINDIHKFVGEIRDKNLFAVSAIEVALLDLLSRRLNIDFIDLIGGRIKKEVFLVGNIGIHDKDTTIDLAKNFYLQGHKTMKMKIGKDIHEDVDKITAVGSIANDLVIRLDANQALTYDKAREYFKRLRGYNIELIEQPLPVGNLELHSKLKQEFKIPLMLDEEIYSFADVVEVYHKKAASYVKTKLFKTGVKETQKIAEFAGEKGIGLIWGNGVESDVGAFAELKVACSIPQINPVCECIGPLKIIDCLTNRTFEVNNGKIKDEFTMGLGIELI